MHHIFSVSLSLTLRKKNSALIEFDKIMQISWQKYHNFDGNRQKTENKITNK